MRNRSVPYAALLAAGLLAACQKPKPPPSIDDLTAALQHSADQAIAAPSLVDAQIIVQPRPGQLAAQTAEIVQLFSAAGGTGLASVNAKGQTSILGSISGTNLEAFKARLRHQNATLSGGGSPAPSILVEVLIDNPRPSPTPTP